MNDIVIKTLFLDIGGILLNNGWGHESRNKAIAHHLRVIALSNEGRELNAYRLAAFQLTTLFDSYISSSFVHRRKPDLQMFRMAMDIAQAVPEESLYIDDTLLFVEVMRDLGMNAIHYQGLEDAKQQLKELGLRLE